MRNPHPINISPPEKVSGEKRFTVDGTSDLEQQLQTICERVRQTLQGYFPPGNLEAIVLGGGYGRGEGGVWRTGKGESPYNDMEFYVYLRGNLLGNEFRHRAKMKALQHELSDQSGVEVEFKMQSLTQCRRSPISMFSYDLIMGHQVVLGHQLLFQHCEHHRYAMEIPLSELTRLLMNRCSGLLFAKKRLQAADFTPQDADFVTRNLAKLRLALGDVVLGVHRQYHWSCRERSRRLDKILQKNSGPWLEAVQLEHQKGVEFKLHPRVENIPRVQLEADFQSLSDLSGKIWLWLEEQRLRQKFKNIGAYALAKPNKCPKHQAWRNVLINLQHFGIAGILSRSRFRYPRERMLRTLPLLLWVKPQASRHPLQRLLHQQLSIGRGRSTGLMDAYTQLWERFR